MWSCSCSRGPPSRERRKRAGRCAERFLGLFPGKRRAILLIFVRKRSGRKSLVWTEERGQRRGLSPLLSPPLRGSGGSCRGPSAGMRRGDRRAARQDAVNICAALLCSRFLSTQKALGPSL
ncbi:hypothetical protein AOLI_G00320950 [Acnodon oligacanthus]